MELSAGSLVAGMDIFIEEVGALDGPGAWGRCEEIRGSSGELEFRIIFAAQCAEWQESVRAAGFDFGWPSDNWYKFELST